LHPSVIVNSVAIIVGSSIGLLIGKTLTDRIRNMIFQAVGLTTLGVGIQMLLETKLTVSWSYCFPSLWALHLENGGISSTGLAY